MMDFKISICLGLCAVISFARSDRISFVNRSVFSKNEKLLSSLTDRSIEIFMKQPDEVSDYEVCGTDECKKMANEFLSSMNRTVDPCDNFYDYVCGGWTQDVIPPNLSHWSRRRMVQEVVNRRIRDILETELEPSDILPVKQAKKWYRSCMDTETLERRGIKPIESILIREGGWPIAMNEEEWDADEHTWQEVANSYLHLTGSHVFYSISVVGAEKNATSSRIDIKPQDLPLAQYMPLKYRNYSGNDYEKYRDFVATIAQMFIEDDRADASKGKLFKDANDIVEFEKQIYELMEEEGDAEHTTLEEFNKWYKQNMTDMDVDEKEIMDWQLWMQNMFDIVNLKVNPSGELYLPNLNYIKGLGELLRKTPTRTIVNYVHWHFVANMLGHTTLVARNELYMLSMEENGIKERPSRWSECVENMKMIHAAAYAFVGKYFTEETESAVTEMTKNIHRAMNKQIDESTWLDEESKTLVKDKLNGIKIFVGFPDWYKDKKLVTSFYKGLTIDNEYFDNVLSYQRYENKKLLRRYSYVAETEEKSESWFMNPITVNAMYMSGVNIINIPAANLQLPFYTPHVPDNIQYGIVGCTIGHEIGHAFDNTGIRYDEDGDLFKFTVSVWKRYYQRAECFIDQFDKYYEYLESPETTETTEEPVRTVRKKSDQTIGDNIADTTGIQAAFEAYKNLEKPERSVRLEGMEEFTDDQLFFVSFAASWCEIGTPKYEEKQKKSLDEHSPPNLRVLASVSNTKGFAEAFNCPAGSPMNPEDKCSVWGKLKKEPDIKEACM